MNIVSYKTLRSAMLTYPRCEQSLKTWFHEVKNAHWENPNDIKNHYPKASVLTGNLVIFDMMGGEFRLCVSVAFKTQWIFVKWFGTHQEYDRINKESGGKGFEKRFGGRE